MNDLQYLESLADKLVAAGESQTALALLNLLREHKRLREECTAARFSGTVDVPRLLRQVLREVETAQQSLMLLQQRVDNVLASEMLRGGETKPYQNVVAEEPKKALGTRKKKT